MKGSLVVLFVLCSCCAFAQQDYLRLNSIVTDSASIFTPKELIELNSKLSQFESETTNQLVILTIPSLGDHTIEEYANKTFNANGLGQKGKDNGILILFARDDREVRIEVGYGLEPYITDAIASRIIRNTMIPSFQEENYVEGLNGATDQIIEFLRNPDALAEFKKELEAEDKVPDLVRGLLALFLSFFIIGGGLFLRKTYSGFIEIIRGVITGKISVLTGLFMLFFGLIKVVVPLLFIVVPIFFMAKVYDFSIDVNRILESPWLPYLIPLFLVFSLLVAILKNMLKDKEDFTLSLFRNDKKYMQRTFSSTGTHSYMSGAASGGRSGGSSSSFSGGGGSSGGGGASGSW